MQGLFAYLAKRWERDFEKDETLKTLRETGLAACGRR